MIFHFVINLLVRRVVSVIDVKQNIFKEIKATKNSFDKTSETSLAFEFKIIGKSMKKLRIIFFGINSK